MFIVCLLASVFLIVAGFFVPPTGEIDGSVLTAVGELLVFPTIAYGARAIELGYDFRLRRGEYNVEITNDDNENGNENKKTITKIKNDNDNENKKK